MGNRISKIGQVDMIIVFTNHYCFLGYFNYTIIFLLLHPVFYRVRGNRKKKVPHCHSLETMARVT